MTVAKIVHFLKWMDKHETLCLNCSNEKIADQYLASYPAQAGGMPGELPTDEEIDLKVKELLHSLYRCAGYGEDDFTEKTDSNNILHLKLMANWLKSRITETKNK